MHWASVLHCYWLHVKAYISFMEFSMIVNGFIWKCFLNCFYLENLKFCLRCKIFVEKILSLALKFL